MATLDLDELTLKTRRQEYADGLNELFAGLVLLLIGALGAFFFSTAGMTFYVRAFLWNRELTTHTLLALLGVVVLAVFGARRGILLL